MSFMPFDGLINEDLGQLGSEWIDLFVLYEQFDLLKKIIDHGFGYLFYIQIAEQNKHHAAKLEKIILKAHKEAMIKNYPWILMLNFPFQYTKTIWNSIH